MLTSHSKLIAFFQGCCPYLGHRCALRLHRLLLATCLHAGLYPPLGELVISLLHVSEVVINFFLKSAKAHLVSFGLGLAEEPHRMCQRIIFVLGTILSISNILNTLPQSRQVPHVFLFIVGVFLASTIL